MSEGGGGDDCGVCLVEEYCVVHTWGGGEFVCAHNDQAEQVPYSVFIF